VDDKRHQLSAWGISAQAFILSLLVRLLRATWRVRVRESHLLEQVIADGGAVIGFWHGEQLPMVPVHASNRIAGVASFSADGELAAQVLHRLGYRVIRGSTSNGGFSALRGCLRMIREGVSPALTLDGPRGPRHVAQLGASGLSARTGRPILYVVSRASHAWRLGSWDGFQIPWPGARVDIVYGLMDAPAPNRSAIEASARELQKRMAVLGETVTTCGASRLDA
jgi:hypothetical protein